MAGNRNDSDDPISRAGLICLTLGTFILIVTWILVAADVVAGGLAVRAVATGFLIATAGYLLWLIRSRRG